MWKFLAGFVLLLSATRILAQNNRRLLDQPMKIRSVKLNVQADPFTATTTLEIEFFNPRDQEIEGLYTFPLRTGQAITGFELELNGHFREGTIEERWKARNSYNQIVGKRVDPALVQRISEERYSLNIYPVPAGSSRRVRFKITQQMETGQDGILFRFPFEHKDSADHFEAGFAIYSPLGKPATRLGMPGGIHISNRKDFYEYTESANSSPLPSIIEFSIPLNRSNTCLIKKSQEENYFAMYLFPGINNRDRDAPKSVAVYWDISRSGETRDLNREINFLEQYISRNQVQRLKVVSFNSTIRDSALFDHPLDPHQKWKRYIRSFQYDGATQLGILDFSSETSDIVLLFSDGRNSFGSATPRTDDAVVYCITSSAKSDETRLNQVVGTGGGSLIRLSGQLMSWAVRNASKRVTWLLRIASSQGNILYDQALPARVDQIMMFSGRIRGEGDTLTFYYGTNRQVRKTEKVIIQNKAVSFPTAIDRIIMLEIFSRKEPFPYWERLLDFGLREKVVTYHTAYIVLERLEDYIKYNIAPPAELEEAARKLGYLPKDSRQLRNQWKKQSEQERMEAIVYQYNQRRKRWDPTAGDITWRPNPDSRISAPGAGSDPSGSTTVNAGALQGAAPGLVSNSLQEVVVVGYGSSLKRNLTGSVVTVQTRDLFSGTATVGQALQGRVAGVQIISEGQPGMADLIRIRGAASLTNSNPLFILDGMPVDKNINDYVNLVDIASVTVLKDAAATAIYGSRGAYGVILVETKKGRRWNGYRYPVGPYRLKDLDDVEYMQQLRATEKGEKKFVYESLRSAYGNYAGFYFDVAQVFFETGLKDDAFEILLNAAEVSDGDPGVLRAIGFTLERWQYFKEAISVYESLLNKFPGNPENYRNLAWACYQAGRFQEAANNLYRGIRDELELQGDRFASIRAMMLDELNAMIAIHGKELDLGEIPASLLKPMPVDLRIILDGNNGRVYNFSVIEPGGARCSRTQSRTKNGGYLPRMDWDNRELAEYAIRQAKPGRYRVRVDSYDYRSSNVSDGAIYGTPIFVRLMIFKNFGRENQTIDLTNVILDNQTGTIEIADTRWE